MFSLSADCLSQSNLARSFSYSCKHHIHNSNSADDKGDTRNGCEKNSKGISYLRKRSENISLRKNGKIRTRGINAMFIGKREHCFFLYLRHKIFSLNTY